MDEAKLALFDKACAKARNIAAKYQVDVSVTKRTPGGSTTHSYECESSRKLRIEAAAQRARLRASFRKEPDDSEDPSESA